MYLYQKKYQYYELYIYMHVSVNLVNTIGVNKLFYGKLKYPKGAIKVALGVDTSKGQKHSCF